MATSSAVELQRCKRGEGMVVACLVCFSREAPTAPGLTLRCRDLLLNGYHDFAQLDPEWLQLDVL